MMEYLADVWNPGELRKDRALQLLTATTIERDRPGTILRDFDTLLTFVGEDGYESTSKYHFLPNGRLAELNARMVRPVAHRLKRPQQRSFPLLHGLFLILRVSGMAVCEGGPPHARLRIDPEMYAAWRQLNPTEQYFALLESWLVEGSHEIIGETENAWANACWEKLLDVSSRLKSRHARDPRFGLVYGINSVVTAVLMEALGWLQLEYGQTNTGGVRLEAAEWLPFGDAMVDALGSIYHATYAARYRLNDNGVLATGETDDDDEDVDDDDAATLQRFFRPYFPELQQRLPSAELPYREGAFTWRVSLGGAWRRIVTPDELPLDELAMEILDAFNFDDDHLYCFEFRDERGRAIRVACPYEEDADYHTDEVRIGDLPLAEGASMIFHFDYGDDWQFSCLLESLGPPDPKLQGAKVTARRGRAPRQYSGWDE